MTEHDNGIYGVVVGTVTQNYHQDHPGQVLLRFPWLSDNFVSRWARVATPVAGKGGMYFFPEVDDEVLVMFDRGNIDAPYVIGALWNGKNSPPVQSSEKNNLRVIKSRSGHTITFDDTNGDEKLTISDHTQKNTIVIDSKANAITITSEKDVTVKATQGAINLDSPKGSLAINCKSLSINATETVSIKANQSATVEASAGLALKSPAGVRLNDTAMVVL